MRRSCSPFAISCAIAILATGCGSSATDVLNKHRKAPDKKLAHLESIGKMVAEVDLPSDGIDLKGRTEPKFSRTSWSDDPPGKGATRKDEDGNEVPAIDLSWNARIMPTEAFDDLTARELLLDVSSNSGLWNEPAKMLNDEAYTKDMGPKDVAATLAAFASWRYALVLRPQKLERPRYMKGDEFEAGVFVGEALLFDIEEEELLGGFELEARSSPEVEESSGMDVLELDFQIEVIVAIYAGLREHLPDAKVPIDPSH